MRQSPLSSLTVEYPSSACLGNSLNLRLINAHAAIGPDLDGELEFLVVDGGELAPPVLLETAVLQGERHLLHVVIEQIVGLAHRRLKRSGELQNGYRCDGDAQ